MKAIECKVVQTRVDQDDYPKLIGRTIVAYTVIDEARTERTYSEHSETAGASSQRIHRIVFDNDTYIEL
jgi:hypothetical protein